MTKSCDTSNCPESREKFKTMIGGQALIEGILMRGPKKQAIVVRTPDGLVEKVESLHSPKDRFPILGWPLIRGVVNFCDSMICGVKALTYSADFFPEEEGEQDAVDRFLEKHVKKETLEKLVVPIGCFSAYCSPSGFFCFAYFSGQSDSRTP